MRAQPACLRWLIAGVAVCVLCLAGTRASVAGAVPVMGPVTLPADHGAHPAFNAEWWYTAGTVADPRGRDYFWFATIWSGLGLQVAKVNVVDLQADRIVLSHEYLRLGAPSGGQTQFQVGAFALGWRPVAPRGEWSLDVPTGDSQSLALDLWPAQPYVLNGQAGIIQQGTGGPSAYYSAPRLAAHGTLQLGGGPLPVRGQGWFDHQWGNFGFDPGALRWNWFACQFDDGSDLMLYQFLDPNDQPTGQQTSTLVAANGAVTHPAGLVIVPLAPVISPPGAIATYPLRWRLEVPSAWIDVTLRSRARNQFITNWLVPSFWEGAAAITHGSPGSCIVESSREVRWVP